MSLAQASPIDPSSTGSGNAGLLSEGEIRTLADLYAARASRTPDAIACRYHDALSGDWKDFSWRDLRLQAQRYVAGFRAAGLVAGERVAVQEQNGPRWLAIDWAAQTLGLVLVGLYNEDTPGNTAHLLDNSGAAFALLRDADGWRQTSALRAFPLLRQVVLQQGGADGPGDRFTAVSTLDEWLPQQAEDAGDAPAVDPESLATIVYTSGSTGPSRGVMLSHKALLANVFACTRALTISPDDRYFSVLPMATLFERVAGAYGAVVAGATTVYARSAAQLGEDLLAAQPSLLIAVPRVYERLHAAVMAGLDQAPAHKRALFNLAIEAGWAAHRRQGRRRLSLSSAIARRAREQFVARLGGRLRLAVSGGAPLAPEIARLFIGLGVPLLQGYGLTEAGPVVSVNRLDDNDPCSAGLPLDNVETRLSPDNELLVRSPSLMLGYWQDAQATAEALDDAGWLHTGDKVSRLDAHRIYLVGRLKEVIVTSTGRKVSPSEIEQRLLAEPIVEQVMVVGEARPFLTALIVPNAEALAALRARLGLAADDDSPIARARLEAELLQRCLQRLASGDGNSLLRAVALVDGPWSVANGLQTPTLKLKRSCIARQYERDIERLYAGHFLPAKTDCSCNAGV